MAKRRWIWCGWVDLIDFDPVVEQDSPPLLKGLAWARRIHRDNRERAKACLRSGRYAGPEMTGEWVPEEEKIAADYAISVSVVRAFVTRARRHFVGDASDETLRHRALRKKKRPRHRECDDCFVPLPPGTPGRIRHCEDHRDVTARVRRHRRRRREQAT